MTSGVRATATAAVVLALALDPAPSRAQVSAFQFDAARVPVGRVFHYVKSNRDGSHGSHVSLFVAAVDRIESLKWDEDSATAALVTATMDWPAMSVRRLESRQLERAKPPSLRAELDSDFREKSATVSFAGEVKRVPIGKWPWHSYDFDFASLQMAMRHLRDPEGEFVFGRADVTYRGDAVSFEDLGDVRVRFLRSERRLGRPARRYSIGGPGMQDQGGILWTDRRDGLLLEFEIPIPDEPGYRDGRLRLERVERMTAAQWHRFQRARVGEKS